MRAAELVQEELETQIKDDWNRSACMEKLRRQMKKKCSSSRSVFTDGMHMKMMCREKISIPCRS